MLIEGAVIGLGKLASLRAACTVPALSIAQIYQVARAAGFSDDPDPLTGNPLAAEMTAVAMRESGGCPTAHNPGPGEDSYGLWQINVQGNPGILRAMGLSDPTALYDPATNAAAAFHLYAGKPANLDTAWYLDRPGYAEAYQQYLPAAEAAAAQVSGPGVLASAPGDAPAPWDTGSSGDGSEPVSASLASGWGLAAASAAGLLLLALALRN